MTPPEGGGCQWIANGSSANKSLTTVKLSIIVAAMQMPPGRQEQGGCHCRLITGHLFLPETLVRY